MEWRHERWRAVGRRARIAQATDTDEEAVSRMYAEAVETYRQDARILFTTLSRNAAGASAMHFLLKHRAPEVKLDARTTGAVRHAIFVLVNVSSKPKNDGGEN
ncbi:DUF3562 domain-containing protein [Paraburkholderia youngii]|uniref:DUF3562 domain-containing protein n=1 Tax=Paraburkholderia youngii TaxID=2782701 RepID=UPI003D24F6F3